MTWQLALITFLYVFNFHSLQVLFYNSFKDLKLADNCFSIFFSFYLILSSTDNWLSIFSASSIVKNYLHQEISFIVTLITLLIQIILILLLLVKQQRNYFNSVSQIKKNTLKNSSEFLEIGKNKIDNLEDQTKSNNLLELGNVFFSYDSKNLLAINNVSLQIQENEFICLAGKNGSGKSTLVKLILGLNKPNKGNIHSFIDDIKFGFVTQQNLNLKFITVNEYISHLQSFINNVNISFVQKIIEDLSLKDHLDTRINELSKGNKRKVAILLGMMTVPDLIVFDEPTANLGILFKLN